VGYIKRLTRPVHLITEKGNIMSVPPNFGMQRQPVNNLRRSPSLRDNPNLEILNAPLLSSEDNLFLRPLQAQNVPPPGIIYHLVEWVRP
jgi:hypothetical protein